MVVNKRNPINFIAEKVQNSPIPQANSFCMESPTTAGLNQLMPRSDGV